MSNSRCDFGAGASFGDWGANRCRNPIAFSAPCQFRGLGGLHITPVAVRNLMTMRGFRRGLPRGIPRPPPPSLLRDPEGLLLR